MDSNEQTEGPFFRLPFPFFNHELIDALSSEQHATPVLRVRPQLCEHILQHYDLASTSDAEEQRGTPHKRLHN